VIAYPWNEDRNAFVIKLLTEEKLPPKQVARQAEITVQNVYWIKRTYGPQVMNLKVKGKSFARFTFTRRKTPS
jgi:DNA invertase Pin-like site-specific DNA recombinase